MSLEMERKLRSLVNIGDKDPNFVLWAGSLKEAIKWERLIRFLADFAQENAETGYNTYPLKDELDLLCWDTFRVLREMGVTLPKEFPKELDIKDGRAVSEQAWNRIMENPYSSLIYEIYKSLNDVYGFYAAYIDELISDDELDLISTDACNIEPCLLSLAACKVEVSQEFAPKIREFKRQNTKDYEEWLAIVKDKAFRAGIPLRAELLALVYNSNDALGHEAEAESLGFSSSRVHPDIYMNELLVGMRIIHQALPAIMKKLEIEFEIDESELHINRS
ncbi:MAG: helix-turn-helix domain protein [Betaproteobacteria bacterium]|nr:helix-turn-helix domain protein [Betaproteobacteria bacterium]